MNLLKQLFCGSFWIFLLGTTNAQSGLGLKAGPNFTYIHVDEKGGSSDETYAVAIQYHASLYYSIPLSGKLSLKPEVQFSVKGARLGTDSEIRGYYRQGVRMPYLSVPLLFNYRLKQMAVEAGPGVAYRLGAYSTENNKDLNLLYDQDWEVSFILGANYLLDRFHLGVHLSLGLTPIGSDIRFHYGSNSFSFDDNTNCALQVSLGYQLL